MDLALTIDFGSTFTKGALFDLSRQEVLGVAYVPSTVDTDVNVGLEAVMTRLEALTHSALHQVPAFVCSSAAGGLRMAVSGLVPSLSLEAAQRAALGAGAKIVGAYGYKLAGRSLRALEQARADIILLAGGTDGGDEETILHNAAALARSDVAAPIIVAGNEAVGEECARRLCAAGKTAMLAANILPEVNQIEADEVHAIIRDLFVKHITRAKGIDNIKDRLNLQAPIVPTPSAVLRALELLSAGTKDMRGWGDLVLVDIGGATTDVHSAGSGAPTRPGVVWRGLPELLLKRTVEGDLGMRVNAGTILERAGECAILQAARDLGAQADESVLRRYVSAVTSNPEHVPHGSTEAALDAALARHAISTAVRRHAGTLREIYTPSGTAVVQEGKDLSPVSTVIGVGGVLAHGRHAKYALEGAQHSSEALTTLCPQWPRYVVDRTYVLFGIGLLADVHPAAAFAIAEATLVPLD